MVDSYQIRQDGQVCKNGASVTTDLNYFYNTSCVLNRDGGTVMKISGCQDRVRHDKDSIWWAIGNIISLNDSGEIITSGVTVWGEHHAVLLVPVTP